MILSKILDVTDDSIENQPNSSQDVEIVNAEIEVEKKPKKNRHKSHKNVGIQKNSCQNGAVESAAEKSENPVVEKAVSNEETEKPVKKKTRRPKRHRNSSAAKLNSDEIENSNVENVGKPIIVPAKAEVENKVYMIFRYTFTYCTYIFTKNH